MYRSMKLSNLKSNQIIQIMKKIRSTLIFNKFDPNIGHQELIIIIICIGSIEVYIRINFETLAVFLLGVAKGKPGL